MHLLVLLGYSLLALAFVYPALPRLTTVTPGNFTVDRNQFLWSFWWFKHALLDEGTNPMYTNLLWYPYGMSLFTNLYCPFVMLVSLPFQALLGTIGAYGLLMILHLPVCAYTAFLLAHYLTRHTFGSFIAGLIFSFSTFHITEFKIDQINIINTEFIPLYILFLIKTVKSPDRNSLIKNTLLAALFSILNGLNSWYFFSYMLLWTAFYWLIVAFRAGVAVNWKPQLWWKKLVTPTLAFAAITALTLLSLSYFIINLNRDLHSGVLVPTEQAGKELDGSLDLLRVWLPSAYHPLWGNQSGLWNGLSLSNTGANLPLFGLALAVTALIICRKQTSGWGLAALGWLVIGLGPSLRFNGVNTGFPLPYRVLAEIPIFNIGRYPERYIILVDLCIGIMAAFGIAALSTRLRPVYKRPQLALASVALLGLVYFETYPGPLQLLPDIGPFPFANYIQADNGKINPNLAVMELPVTKHWTSDSERMLYQIYHQRPMLGGYVSLKAIDLYRFGAKPYPLYDLLDLRGFQPDIVEPHTREQWQGLLNYGGYGYLVVYPQDLTPDQSKKIDPLLNAILGPNTKPDFVDNTARVYTVPPGGKLTDPVLLLGWGWYQLENVGGGKMQRWIQLDEKNAGEAIVVVGPDTQLKSSYSLEFEAAPYQKSRSLEVWLNGAQVGKVKVEGVQKFRLDNLKLQQGENLLSFKPDPTDGFASPSDQGNSEDTRRLTIALLSLKLL